MEAEKNNSGGEDTLELSFWVTTVFEKDWVKLCDVLEQTRQDAEKENKKISLFLPNRCELLVNFCGAGMRGNYFRYVTECDGITLLLKDKATTSEGRANASVRVGSLLLMQYGIVRVFEAIDSLFKQLGLLVLKDCIARVDVATDFPNLSMRTVKHDFVKENYVCRAEKYSIHGRMAGQTVETLNIGAGGAPIMCRLYDKVQELKDKPDPQKEACLVERWGCKPETAVRCEFQLRREFLQTLGVKTRADWLKKRAEIVDYLYSEWLRFCETGNNKKNGNHSRITTNLEWWETMKNLAKQWAGNATAKKRIYRDGRPCIERLAQGAKGYVTSILASEGVEATPEAVEEYITDKLVPAMLADLSEMVEKTREKQADLRGKGVILPLATLEHQNG